MTENNELRAVVLAALMVFSVFGGTIAFAGAASAITYDRGTGNAAAYDTVTSIGDVGPGEIIFQGEEDIQLQDGSGGNLAAAEFERASGDNAGVPLSIPVDTDQTTGTYETSGGVTVTVASPSISTFDVQNEPLSAGVGAGSDVNGGTLVADASPGSGAHVEVNSNFEEAESVELTVEDENGVDVTNEIVAGSADAVADGTDASGDDVTPVGIDLDPTGLDEGEYTFSISGTEDLDFGDATQSTTVQIVTEETANLDLSSDEVVQGENIDFTIDGTSEGNFHGIFIDSQDFNDGITADEADDIFRNVGDTVDTGIVNASGINGGTDINYGAAFSGTGTLAGTSSPTVLDADNLDGAANDPGAVDAATGNPIDVQVSETVDYAFAIVEIDGGSGVGSIETQNLDDTSVTVEVAPSNSAYLTSATPPSHDPAGQLLTDVNTDDDVDLAVNEGEVSLNQPVGSYVTGSEVTINGTANPGVDDVAIYVRDQDDFELARIGDGGSKTITVEGDNTFEEEDVQIGFPSSADDESGNNILSLPGTYRIGVIDVEDAAIDSSGPDNSLTTSEFNQGISTTESIVVTDTALAGSFVTYNGQVADDDGLIDFNGTAAGKDGGEIVVAFVGPRGGTVADTVTVESDSTFDRDDFDISGLSQGTVSAHLLSAGRDGEFGEGDSADFSGNPTVEEPGDVASAIEGLSGTGDQVRSSILANTVDSTASDDLIVTETFRLSDGLTTVETVTSPVEGNGTIEVTGQTNRRADDNTITAELLDQSGDSITLSSTEQWGTDGTYSVNVSLDGVQPGEYTLEVDDGDNTDRAPVEVVEQVDEEETATATPEPDTPTPTPTPTPEPDTPTPTEEPADDTETDTPSTGTGTPGFGIVVALTALIAAALLAVRRTN